MKNNFNCPNQFNNCTGSSPQFNYFPTLNNQCNSCPNQISSCMQNFLQYYQNNTAFNSFNAALNQFSSNPVNTIKNFQGLNTVNKIPNSNDFLKKLQNQSETTNSVCTMRKLIKFRKLALKAHNKYRKLHGCPSLKISNRLNKSALEYAQKLAKMKQYCHSTADERNNAGENLHEQYVSYPDANKIVYDWYNEIELYSYENPVFSKDTGHFTQLVWKDTERVGFGVAVYYDERFNMNHFIIVAHYSPAGNVDAKTLFESNVPRIVPKEQTAYEKALKDGKDRYGDLMKTTFKDFN